MHEKIKNYQRRATTLLQNFQDVRTIGLIMFAFVALLITWSGIKVVETNYRLQQEIAVLQQRNTVQELENRNIALQNQFFETDEYLELEARRNFGLAAPGETVYVVPKAAALNRVLAPEDSESSPAPAEQAEPTNFDIWMDFLFGSRPKAN